MSVCQFRTVNRPIFRYRTSLSRRTHHFLSPISSRVRRKSGFPLKTIRICQLIGKHMHQIFALALEAYLHEPGGDLGKLYNLLIEKGKFSTNGWTGSNHRLAASRSAHHTLGKLYDLSPISFHHIFHTCHCCCRWFSTKQALLLDCSRLLSGLVINHQWNCMLQVSIQGVTPRSTSKLGRTQRGHIS